MQNEIMPDIPLSKSQISAIEQKTLAISLVAVLVLALGSILYGLIIESDVVILNGVLSLTSLIGSSLNLWGAKLVTSDENSRFQFGYWHIEPLIHCFNAFMLLIVCIYGALNGIHQMRNGGNPTDASQVIIFGFASAVVCGFVWIYEKIHAKKTGSQFIRNDANEWFLDFCLSLATMLGFIPLFFLSYPYKYYWTLYADSTMLVILSLLLTPLPIGVLKENIPEVLLMATSNAELLSNIDREMKLIEQEFAIERTTHHIAKVGQIYFIEAHLLVDPDCELQTIEIQDQLRERIWKASELPYDSVWLTVSITADKRWI